MAGNIYKVVYIIGPRTKHAATWGKLVFSDNNCLYELQHDHKDILVIGDGINPIPKDSIDALRDKIANNTLITIIANGSHLLKKHYIHIYNLSSFTASFLQDLQKTNPSTPLNVLIYSSNSGYASSDVAYLIPNSMLITYSRDDLSNEFLSGLKNTVNALLNSECADILSCYLKKGAQYLPERFGASFSLTKTESFIAQTVNTIKYYLGLYPQKDTDYTDCEIQLPNNDKNTLSNLPTVEKLFQDFESCIRDALHPTNLNSTIAFKDFIAHTHMRQFFKQAIDDKNQELLNTTLQFYSDRTKTGEFSNDEFYTIARQLENLNIPEEYIESLRDFLVECITSTPTGIPYFFVAHLLHKFKVDIGVFFDPKIPVEILDAAKFTIIKNLTPQTVDSLINHGMKIEVIAQALSYYCDEPAVDKFIYLFDRGYTPKKENNTYSLSWQIFDTLEATKFFLDAGLDPDSYIGKYGLVPLRYVLINHPSALEKVKLLIEHGADPLFGVEEGHSVFQQSGWRFSEKFAEEMYPNSQEILKQISKILLNATSNLSDVADWMCGMCYIDDENYNLCYSKEANFTDCSKPLVAKQWGLGWGDIKKENSTYNLDTRILSNYESIKLFLDAGLDPNSYIGEYGTTPLSAVIYHDRTGALEKVKLLFEHGADPLFGVKEGNSVFQNSGWIFSETFREYRYPNNQEILKQISKILLNATPSLSGVSDWMCGMCYIDTENFSLCYKKETNLVDCSKKIIDQEWHLESLDYKFAFLVEIGFLVSSLYTEHNQRNSVFSMIDYHPVFEGQKPHFGFYDHCYNNTETGYYHLSVVTDVTHIVNDYRSEVLNELGIFDQRIDKCYLGVNEFVDELLISKYANFQDITPLVALPSC